MPLRAKVSQAPRTAGASPGPTALVHPEAPPAHPGGPSRSLRTPGAFSQPQARFHPGGSHPPEPRSQPATARPARPSRRSAGGATHRGGGGTRGPARRPVPVPARRAMAAEGQRLLPPRRSLPCAGRDRPRNHAPAAPPANKNGALPPGAPIGTRPRAWLEDAAVSAAERRGEGAGGGDSAHWTAADSSPPPRRPCLKGPRTPPAPPPPPALPGEARAPRAAGRARRCPPAAVPPSRLPRRREVPPVRHGPFKRPRRGSRRASIVLYIKGGRAAAAVTAGARRGGGGSSRCRHGLQREKAGVGRGGLLLPGHAGEAGWPAARRHGSGARLRRRGLGPAPLPLPGLPGGCRAFPRRRLPAASVPGRGCGRARAVFPSPREAGRVLPDGAAAPGAAAAGRRGLRAVLS